MPSLTDFTDKEKNPILLFGYGILRFIVALSVPLITFLVLYGGFQFLKGGEEYASMLVVTIIAILWGIIGISLLFYALQWIIKHLPSVLRDKLTPFIFVGPALIVLTYFIILPTIRSFWISMLSARGDQFVGLANYIYTFTDPTMLTSFLNTFVWIVVGTGGSVAFGLIFAILTDKSKIEKVSKSFIFMPLAISFVGAGAIWKFVYAFKPVGYEQIGILNAVVEALGGQPQVWLTIRPFNTLFLVLVFVWMQTGYSMVILSAAIKNVPDTLKEAARIDGANEFQVVFNVVIPYVRSTIITVATTLIVLSLKIFDIVYALTNGQYGTEILATQQYKYMFKYNNNGVGAAIAIILLILVIPVMVYNLRQFGEREVF